MGSSDRLRETHNKNYEETVILLRFYLHGQGGANMVQMDSAAGARGTPGRLRACLREWKRIGAPKQVRQWIKHGVRLPLTGAVPRRVEPNHVPAEAGAFMDERWRG